MFLTLTTTEVFSRGKISVCDLAEFGTLSRKIIIYRGELALGAPLIRCSSEGRDPHC